MQENEKYIEDTELNDTENIIDIIDMSEEKDEKLSTFKSRKEERKEKKLLLQISELEKNNEDLKDKYLRIVAEYDNYRRRTAKEKLELGDNIKSHIILDFLPVVDDIDRAITFLNSNNNPEDIEKNIEGINLIAEKFYKFLKSQGVVEIEAKNADFNLDFHEAVTKFQVQDEAQKGKVIDVIQKGYKMNDKIVRFAKVVVGE